MFSCLFDTGAEVSCMNVDTCTALGLLNSVSDTNTQVNMASGQDMGVLGHVMVTFKLGKQSFTHKFLVCRFLTRPFILGEDYLSKNCMRMEWDGNRRAISYMNNVLVTASQEVMEEPLKLCNAIKIPARSFVVAPTYCSQMFTGRVCARPSDELKHKFPNLYMEPIQFDNSEGKQQKEIPYMIINLDYNDEVYIGKNTHVAYIEDESVECNYIEVCESIESTECRNWVPKRKIVNSDLVYSPAQVTEHQRVELRDQDVPEETKLEFEKLKADYPEVFSLNNQDIGHTQLVTMHVDTGDSPPICQKPLHFTFKTLQLGTTGGRDPRESRYHQKEPQSMGQSNCCCSQEIHTW